MLPGEVRPVPIDGGDALTKALLASGNRVVVMETGSNPQKGEIGVLGIVQPGATPMGSDGQTLKALVAARWRVRLLDIDWDGDVPFAQVELPELQTHLEEGLAVLARTTLDEFCKCFGAEFRDRGEQSTLDLFAQVAEKTPHMLADVLATSIVLTPEKRKELLHASDPMTQLKLISDIMTKIKDDDEDDLDALAKKIAEAGMPEPVLKKCEKELKKLGRMNPDNSNYTVILNWLEEMVTIPWNKTSETEKDLQKVTDVLDAGIFGLDEVKEFVTEDVGVQLHTGKPSGSVLNLNGPPGVGKTAVGEVIARATGREFVRISLGGLHDEADIRGHRITYVGAIMGRIMKAFQEAGTTNPVIQLDEIDKMGENGMNGDPSAALLEVLDQAQNSRFRDHYLGVDFDASKAMFICSANEPDMIPEPLYDRMDNFDLDGYNDDEKLVIAKDHLIKKQMEKYELTDAQFSITDPALAKLIDGYTYEAGVRSLEKLIRKLARKAIKEIVKDRKNVTITPENLEKYLGPTQVEREMVDPTPRVGHVNGLAVSGGSGSVLKIEADMYADPQGGTEATGNLMETIEESVRYSDAWVKAHAAELGIPPEVYLDNTLHIKIADGGVPVDGPSAGLALATLETSVRTGIPIRGDVAMTGEISVLGESGIIGGLKQKLDGAFRQGIRTVLIPAANMKDFKDPRFPKKLKENLEIMPDANADNLAPVPEGKMRIIPVKNEMEVLRHALVRMPEPLTAEEDFEDEGVTGEFNAAAISDETVYRVADAVLQRLLENFNGAGAIPAKPANDDGSAPPVARKSVMAGKAATALKPNQK
jgi:endopeptidase La